MPTRRLSFALHFVALALLASACATTGASSISSDPQARGAAESLVTLDGKPFNLPAIVASKDATVLVWWSSSCPCVKRYQTRVEALTTQLDPARVAVIAVSSNADDSRQSVAALASGHTYDLPLALDPGGNFADRLGVISTPTTVVLDRQGVVRYLGWLDNERKPGEDGRQPWLEDAVNRVLAGEPGPTRAPVYGCRITKSLGEAPSCKAPEPSAPAPCHGE